MRAEYNEISPVMLQMFFYEINTNVRSTDLSRRVHSTERREVTTTAGRTMFNADQTGARHGVSAACSGGFLWMGYWGQIEMRELLGLGGQRGLK